MKLELAVRHKQTKRRVKKSLKDTQAFKKASLLLGKGVGGGRVAFFISWRVEFRLTDTLGKTV